MIPYAGKLYAKLAEVVTEVEGVAKSGKNTFHKYDYTTAEEMLRALRGPLATRKIALMPSLQDISEREITTAKGGVSTITTVRVRFTLADGETGETYDCEWAGQGDDPADKGLGKAYTNAIKTFLREQFLIPQGDDPEADEKTDKRGAERAAKHGEGNKTQKIYKPDDRTLNDEERAVVVEGIAHVQDKDMLLRSVGCDDLDALTVSQGREVLRKAKPKPAAA